MTSSAGTENSVGGASRKNPWVRWALIGVLILGVGWFVLARSAPKTTEVRSIFWMDTAARNAQFCGKSIKIDATVVASDDPRVYYAQDLTDRRAELDVVMPTGDKAPAEGSRVSVLGRLVCDPPYPLGTTYYLQEFSRH